MVTFGLSKLHFNTVRAQTTAPIPQTSATGACRPQSQGNASHTPLAAVTGTACHSAYAFCVEVYVEHLALPQPNATSGAKRGRTAIYLTSNETLVAT